MMILKRYCGVVLSMALIFISASLLSCEGSDSEDAGYVAEWKTNPSVGYGAGSATIIVKAPMGTKWSAEVSDGGEWCYFLNGGRQELTTSDIVDGAINVLYVYFKANRDAVSREAMINFTFEGQQSQVFTLTQSTESDKDSPRFGVWAELPSHRQGANYDYKTHLAEVDGYNARNFSMCFDESKKVALWVAYPMHAMHMGSIARPNDPWGFDPLIPSSSQANLAKGSYTGSWDRGHQLANADRNGVKEMQLQTFYNSNSTPQLDVLNRYMWARLEADVRGYSCSDTLYVVTGCHYGANYTETTDKSGNICPVPTNYYKVLLRTKSGRSGKAIADCSADELQTIAFWVEQKRYDGVTSAICTSVSDVEAKTGFEFFPQVDKSVKLQNNPADWGIN